MKKFVKINGYKDTKPIELYVNLNSIDFIEQNGFRSNLTYSMCCGGHTYSITSDMYDIITKAMNKKMVINPDN